MRQSLLSPQGERQKGFAGPNGAASLLGTVGLLFPLLLVSEVASMSHAGLEFHREWRTLNDALTACIIVS